MCYNQGSYKELWETEATVNPAMMVDKGLWTCAFKGEWDSLRKGGKGRSKIVGRQFPLSI